MRRVNINTLKKTLHLEIKDLPFIITSFGKDKAVVGGPQDFLKGVGVPLKEGEELEMCQNPGCGVRLPPAQMPIHAKIVHGVG